jgi:flagellar capping protein FliD
MSLIDKLSEDSYISIYLDKEENKIGFYESLEYYGNTTLLSYEEVDLFIEELKTLQSKLNKETLK